MYVSPVHLSFMNKYAYGWISKQQSAYITLLPTLAVTFLKRFNLAMCHVMNYIHQHISRINLAIVGCLTLSAPHVPPLAALSLLLTGRISSKPCYSCRSAR